jgi:hypothetical protein
VVAVAGFLPEPVLCLFSGEPAAISADYKDAMATQTGRVRLLELKHPGTGKLGSSGEAVILGAVALPTVPFYVRCVVDLYRRINSCSF